METKWKMRYPQDYTWLEKHKKAKSVRRINSKIKDGKGPPKKDTL
jgi:hypothetical protein